ncbi:riboflavin synthase [Clostridium thermopalmarium]|uniref:Riboflavin synthase n=1 Tax=Clostridium thermopalmarium DSM 5974 TaxID=1121340 RepID=A0A2T0ARR2_9CLOT|nr:riboflavin synthase [Clostridium thermopalmarium]MBE6043942.1 riboflavin synthase [Clostridium thermopalmarium]PRR72091.1 Riboflavin synthase [Clostridium thermopalmarium DSM 5974]PVZ23743.1 riboflavin synthase alpha chain [Clostridium thermopalmarium DSM 5974]
MFTGIVEEIGKVDTVVIGRKSARIKIHAKKVLEDVKLGDSISTNGVCLTVTEFDDSSFTVDVMAETMRRSNLGNLQKGSMVNLERALKIGDRLGGHIVSGHIDGVGVINELKREDNAIWVSIGAPLEILRYVVLKGSIAIDGVSLTVAYVDDNEFKVSVIPHTQEETTLTHKKVGDKVNLECDMIGKYIEKLLVSREISSCKRGIDEDFLRENGFL